MKNKKYRRAVFIVVYRKDKEKIKYLLLKRKLHWKGWEFPKGGIEKNETPVLAIIRELKEETGQKAENIRKFKEKGKYQYYQKYSDRLGFIGQTWQLFSAEIKSSKIKPDKKEHSSYRWFEHEKALKLLTWQNQKKCLKLVNNINQESIFSTI